MENDVQKLLKNYQPSPDVIKTLRSRKLVIIAGITGAGKNTIMNELLKTGEYHDLITATTRAPRENDGVMEVDGVDYYFLTKEQAIERVKRHEYVEVAPVHERINGLLVDELERARDEGKIAMLDVDVQGVAAYESLSDAVISVFVLPPSYDEWIRRVRDRYPDEAAFQEAWPVRRRSAIMELEEALSKPYYHFVVNDNLPDAVHAVDRIAHKNDEFNQIDTSFHVWAEKILAELKSRTEGRAA